MTVYIDFIQDTKTENTVTTIESPFDDRGQAADKINEMLRDTATGSSAMMRVRDGNTGDFHFFNTMKLADVVIREEDEQ